MKRSLAQIAIAVDGILVGDGDRVIGGVAPFDRAGPTEITLAENKGFLRRLDETGAAAVIVPAGFTCPDKPVIQVDHPRLVFARVMEIFHPVQHPPAGISEMASVAPDLVCGDSVFVAPFVAIGREVTMGDRTVLHSGAVIGDGVTLGDDVVIHPNVSVLDGCRIGSRVTIHAGTVIGSDGFGFVPDGREYRKIPQTGIVQIDDDVEIGAGCTIDRATFGKTWIQRGVKMDNLIQVAHNVTVGKNSILVAQVGIAGSTAIGEHVVLAGQAGISGHLTIGDDATVGPRAGVAREVPKGAVVSGVPAFDHRLWLRVQRMVPKLPEMGRRLSALEKRLAALVDGAVLKKKGA
jgi:UDP-3-O-[3-hydroxymyristoyl] glucosamine N-acyltransferase